MTKFALVLAVAIAAGPVSAGSITTLYNYNNWGTAGNAVFFDIVVGGRDIYITGLFTNTSSMSAFTMDIYTRAGTYVGTETSSTGWTLRANGSGAGAGLNNASAVTLSQTIHLLANTTYGVALDMGTTAEHRYTNGSGPVTTYANSDLTLKLGSAMNSPFTSEDPSTPRVWNGTLVYAIPLPYAAGMSLAGLGLVCGVRRRRGV